MKTKMTLAAAGLLCASAQAQAAPTTFVHLFEWNWQDVATECEQFLGPKGFAAVQVSPPNEHIQGSQWWTRYQPVSYALESRGGNRAQFIDMVQRCNAAGVEIYVDAIINHMANGSGTGTAGSSYGNRQYPMYGPQDFHDSCPINNEDYGQNRWRVQNCELVGLPDLKTENAYVQSKLADYMNDLVSIGVTGFRLDASKHMPAYDIGQILTQVNGNPLIFQEVIDQGGEAVTAAEYTGNGLVTEFKYTTMLGDTFKTGKLAWLSNFGEAWGMMPSYQAVVFVDNHDNQRGHGGAGNVVTYQDGKLYDLANVFMLAYPYGYPKVMSSYDYHHDTDAGGPGYSVHDNGNLNCFGSGWQCEHRWSMIHGAVDFRNNVNSNWQVSNWWDNGNNQIAFSRGDAGFVAINREGYGMSQTLQTGLSEGTYCDVLTGQKSEAGNSCSGRSVVVAGDGTANVTLDQMDALAIHQASKLSSVITIPGDVQRTVVFIKAETQSGQDMFIRGGIDHGFAATQGITCTEQNKQCAISIEHNNLINATTAPWKNNDQYLDWYGVEAGQPSSAEGTALDWTVDVWPSTWGQKRTVAIDGYGEEPLNQYGPHYWMLDVQMDCSQTHNGWFEIKAFVKNGQGWESDIQQVNAPYTSNNHFAQCGKINVFEFGQNGSQHLDF